jgi:hypothetical protein
MGDTLTDRPAPIKLTRRLGVGKPCRIRFMQRARRWSWSGVCSMPSMRNLGARRSAEVFDHRPTDLASLPFGGFESLKGSSIKGQGNALATGILMIFSAL